MAKTVKEYIEARSTFDPDDPGIESLIEIATELTSDCFGNFKNYGIALLVMHMATLGKSGGNQSNGQTGSLKSEKEGQLQLSYGFTGSYESRNRYLEQTSYGLELLDLMDRTLVLPMNRFTDTC
jgi:hypothetical protein